MIQAEFLKHLRWQLNKMKINLVRNLLQSKAQMNRKESKRMNIWFIPGFSENNLFAHL